MPRRTALVSRHTNNRRASLLHIATEDARYDPKYIEDLQLNGVIDRDKVICIPVPSTDNRSSPRHVLDRLNEHLDRIPLDQDDEAWLMLDVDAPNRMPELSAVVAEALRKNYGVAVSNPCSEVWLHLHFDEAVPTSTACAEVTASLGRHRDAAHRAEPGKSPWTRERVVAAIERAKKLDTDTSARWPPTPPGTRAYVLFERALHWPPAR